MSVGHLALKEQQAALGAGLVSVGHLSLKEQQAAVGGRSGECGAPLSEGAL